jgi:hypothetical protein
MQHAAENGDRRVVRQLSVDMDFEERIDGPGHLHMFYIRHAYYMAL